MADERDSLILDAAVERKAAAIRRTWSARERAIRAALPHPDEYRARVTAESFGWLPPVVSAANLGLD